MCLLEPYMHCYITMGSQNFFWMTTWNTTPTTEQSSGESPWEAAVNPTEGTHVPNSPFLLWTWPYWVRTSAQGQSALSWTGKEADCWTELCLCGSLAPPLALLMERGTAQAVKSSPHCCCMDQIKLSVQSSLGEAVEPPPTLSHQPDHFPVWQTHTPLAGQV